MHEGHDFSVTVCIYDCLLVLIHGLQVFRILYKMLASVLTTHSLRDGPGCSLSEYLQIIERSNWCHISLGVGGEMFLSLDYLLLAYL